MRASCHNVKSLAFTRRRCLALNIHPGQVFGRLDITNNGLSPLERIYLIDRHTTMETPIYSGPFPMTQCPLPPPNYLWISPLRTAYPGWHHQLILHLFACDRNWLQPVLDLDKVKAHLAINYPCYMMDDLSLEAIGSEYIRLDRIMQTAYRFVEPFVPVHRPRYDGFVRYLDGAKERLLEHVIDPALFLSHGNPGVLDPALFEEPKKEHVLDPTLSGGDQSSSSLRQAFSSCPRLTSGRTAGNKYGHETQGVINSNPKIEELKHEPTSRTESSTGPQPSRPFKVTKPRPRSLDSRRKTLSNNFVPSTLPTSSSYQFIDLPDSARPPSLSPTLTDSLYDIPTHTGSITKDVGQILFYAKNIHKVRQSNINIDMSPPRQQPLEIKIIDGNTIDTSEMRLPDPTKYIQTSRNHFTIPASEAEAFCYVSLLCLLLHGPTSPPSLHPPYSRASLAG